MNYLFMPWELELDVDATKELYEMNNYATDQRANDEFISKLSADQKDFFESLGVSLEKIKVDKKIYDISADGEMPAVKMYSMTVDFLLCGKFLVVPSFQKELYSDEEIFAKEFPEYIKAVSYTHLDVYKRQIRWRAAGIPLRSPSRGNIWKDGGFHWRNWRKTPESIRIWKNRQNF